MNVPEYPFGIPEFSSTASRCRRQHDDLERRCRRHLIHRRAVIFKDFQLCRSTINHMQKNMDLDSVLILRLRLNWNAFDDGSCAQVLCLEFQAAFLIYSSHLKLF